MFAVVETGGKQYRVAVDDIIKVEKLAGETGDKVQLSSVLLVGDAKATKIGTPYVDGTVVSAEILEQARGDKIIVFKKKRRKNYRRTQGHRQYLTVLKILEIGGAKKSAAKPSTKPASKPAAKKAIGEGDAPKAKPKAKAKAAPTGKKAPAKSASKTDKSGAAKAKKES